MIEHIHPGARRRFGITPDGEEIEEVALAGGGLRARLLSWGAALRDLRLDGLARPLTLGFDDAEGYLRDGGHVGVIAGRCANRIAGASLALDGTTYKLDRNHGAHMLHGGARGFGRRLWRVEAATTEAASFGLASPDGECGFPGRLHARCVYRLVAPRTLVIELTAETDAPTVVNLAQHGYFALQAGADARVCRLHVAAESYTPTDAELIPTGVVAPVAGTPFDFRRMRVVGAPDAPAFDLNYVLSSRRNRVPRFAARLEAPDGLAMSLWTTEPGLQFYDAKHLAEGQGGCGRAHGPHAGLCLEPQCWPDAPHRPGFPSAVLRPGETYRQITELRFEPPRGV